MEELDSTVYPSGCTNLPGRGKPSTGFQADPWPTPGCELSTATASAHWGFLKGTGHKVLPSRLRKAQSSHADFDHWGCGVYRFTHRRSFSERRLVGEDNGFAALEGSPQWRTETSLQRGGTHSG